MANPFKTAAKLVKAGGQKSIRASQLLRPGASGRPMHTDWDFQKAVKEGFKGNVWVYAATMRLMRSAASVPLIVHEPATGDDGNESWSPVDSNHPLQQLINRPNEWMGREELVERMVAHLTLGGNGLTSMVMARTRVAGSVRNVPVELWNIPPKGVRPIPKRSEFIAGYKLPEGSHPERLDAKEVIHLQLPDPDNPYWGMSPLKAAARTIDTDNHAAQWNRVSMSNRAVPDGVFSFGTAINREQWEEARAMVREQYQGSSNARTPWVLGNEAKWHPMSQTAVELDFIRSRHMNREEIAAAIGVPLPLIGVYEDATLANLEASRKILWEDTVIPLLEAIRDAFNHRLVPFFGDTSKLWIDFDTSGIEALQEKFADKLDQAKAMFEMGVPVQIISQRLDLELPEFEGWDQSYLPSGMVPVSMLGGTDLEDL